MLGKIFANQHIKEKMTIQYSKKLVTIIALFNISCVVFRTNCIEIVEVPKEFHNLTSLVRQNLRNDSESDVANSTERYTSVRDGGIEAPGDQELGKSQPVTEDTGQKENQECRRECVENSDPMICTYHFVIENYQTMSKSCYECPFNVTHCNLQDCIPGNGLKRSISVVNRIMPGPSIEVCQGDIVQVHVLNHLLDETTSIHWHGQHQIGSQFMDGVPYVTQCPIMPGTTFTYRFNASIAGTHFWHSHSAFQRGDGVFGALIVRVPRSKDQYSDYYDYDLSDHIIQIIDWANTSSMPVFLSHYHSDGDNKPESILVNGKGRFQEFVNKKNRIVYTPLHRFTVAKGFRYRFRMINAGFLNCPIEMSVDNHTLVVINSDGNDLEPVEAQSLVSYAGERFDFIIYMNQEVDNYWIRFKGLMDCDERFTSAFQTAILQYQGADDVEPTSATSYGYIRKGLQINSLNVGTNAKDSLIMSELRATPTRNKDPRLKAKADFKAFISYDFYPKDHPYYHRPLYYGFNQSLARQRVFTPQLNHITMKFPPFPLMGNYNETKRLEFCNSTSIPRECETEVCECTHLLRVPINSIVELILIDRGFAYDANHPFHLHGYNFRVIGMDRLGANITEQKVRELDERGLLQRNFNNAPIKDTVTVPDGGYTIIRWQATNPGFWLFHCHIDFHVEVGMAMVFRVGDDADLPRMPKNFPQCNSYNPNLETPADETITYKNYEKDYNFGDIIFNQIDENSVQTLGQLSSSNNLGPSYYTVQLIVISNCVINIFLSL